MIDHLTTSAGVLAETALALNLQPRIRQRSWRPGALWHVAPSAGCNRRAGGRRPEARRRASGPALVRRRERPAKRAALISYRKSSHFSGTAFCASASALHVPSAIHRRRSQSTGYKCCRKWPLGWTIRGVSCQRASANQGPELCQRALRRRIAW